MRRFRTHFSETAIAAGVALGCSGQCPTIEECDIRTPSCQERAAVVASCLRGGSAVEPPIIVVDANAFVESKVAESERHPETEDERDLRRGLALFNLASQSVDQTAVVRAYWKEVAAFFSPENGTVTVLDHGTTMGDSPVVELLVHELVHAMQHRSLGESYFTKHARTYDESLALTATLEGEAVLYQDLATAYGWGRDPDDVDWDAIFRRFEALEWASTRQNDSGVVLASLRFPYAFGGAYLNRAWRLDRNDSVRSVLAGPPSSTRELLAGFGATKPGGRGWKEDPNDVGAPLLSADFVHVATRHLGAWLFEIFRDIWRSEPRTFEEFRDSGFSGDVLSVFRIPESSDVAAFWRLRFAGAPQAAGFDAQLVGPPSMAKIRDGRDVILIASTNDTFPATFLADPTWTSAPAEDAGAAERQAALGLAPFGACLLFRDPCGARAPAFPCAGARETVAK